MGCHGKTVPQCAPAVPQFWGAMSAGKSSTIPNCSVAVPHLSQCTPVEKQGAGKNHAFIGGGGSIYLRADCHEVDGWKSPVVHRCEDWCPVFVMVVMMMPKSCIARGVPSCPFGTGPSGYIHVRVETIAKQR